MKCPKCKHRKGKLKHRDDKWSLLGFAHTFFLSRYKCTCCEFQTALYRREVYSGFKDGVLQKLTDPSNVDEDWLEKCREHKLKMENPTEAFVLDRLASDGESVYEVAGRDMGKYSMSRAAVSINRGPPIPANNVTISYARQAGKSLTRQTLKGMIDKFNKNASMSFSIPLSVIKPRCCICGKEKCKHLTSLREEIKKGAGLPVTN